MIGNKFFAPGITLKYGYGGSDFYGWWARADFQDNGHAQDNTTSGCVHNNYAQDIKSALDVVIHDAEKLGIEFVSHLGTDNVPWLFYINDGDSTEYPPPKNWKEILTEQAKRLGWQTYRLANNGLQKTPKDGGEN